MRRRGRGSGLSLSRRKLLLGAGAALTGAGLTPTGAFSQFTGGRGSSVELGGGLVGIDAADTISKSSVSELLTVKNNLDEKLTVTVTLASEDQSSTDLYLNGTNVGDSVTFDISAGIDQIIEAETSLSQGSYVNWKLDASTASGTSISTDGRAEVTTGNKEDAVKINKFDKLSANAGKDEFTVGKAIGKDADGDDDLDFAEFTAYDPNNDQIGETTDSSEITGGGAEYKVNGPETITISASEDVTAGTTYTLRFKLVDADGNYESVTKDVTA